MKTCFGSILFTAAGLFNFRSEMRVYVCPSTKYFIYNARSHRGQPCGVVGGRGAKLPRKFDSPWMTWRSPIYVVRTHVLNGFERNAGPRYYGTIPILLDKRCRIRPLSWLRWSWYFCIIIENACRKIIGTYLFPHFLVQRPFQGYITGLSPCFSLNNRYILWFLQ